MIHNDTEEDGLRFNFDVNDYDAVDNVVDVAIDDVVDVAIDFAIDDDVDVENV